MKRLIPPPQVMPIFGGFVDQFLKSLFGITSAHGAAIAELEAKIAGGAMFVDNFNRPDSPTLGNGWIQGGTGGGGLAIIDYAARLVGRNDVGQQYAICPQLMSSGNHAVAGIVNPNGVMDGCPTSLVVRSNADMTDCVMARFWRTRIWLGRAQRSGNDWTYTAWREVARGVAESDTVELYAVGVRYTVMVNRSSVLEYFDDTGYPVDDPARRTVGFCEETRYQGIIPNWSWGMAAFTARAA
ncbi:hypothetical protein [Nocardia niigatensis]